MTSQTSDLRLAFAISLTPCAFVAGCGGTADTTMTDAGPLMVVDSGDDLPDSYVEPDAYEPPDAGDGICGDSISAGWAALPASCLPRCSAATHAAVQACTTAPNPEACVTAAVAMDTTPTVHVRWAGGVLDVSCAGDDVVYSCIIWQVLSCQYDACPADYNAYIACRGGGGACATEYNTLDACARATAGWNSCLSTRGDACYAP